LKLLYVCTHNACRSILAEVKTRQLLGDQVAVRSAGSNPAGRIHPLTLRYLAEQGYNTNGLASESFDDMRDFDPDIVITVCDRAAAEACPAWLGTAARVHWGLPDPSHSEGDEQAKLQAFEAVMQTLASRLAALQKHDLEALQPPELAEAMQSMDKLL
jgi:arsenate reductase (thioredoxin)